MKEVFCLRTIGPNRYSDEPVFDQLLRLDAAEADCQVRLANLRRHLSDLGVELPEETVGAWSSNPGLGDLYGQLCIALQRHVGHRVGFLRRIPRDDPRELHVVFEVEHHDVGNMASRMALALLAAHCPGLGWPEAYGEPVGDLAAQIGELGQLGAATLFPPDSASLMLAARRRDLACVKLERPPYPGLAGAFRLRPNSMLKLGQCAFRRVLDGMLCVDRSHRVVAAYHDRASLTALSARFGLVVPDRAHRQGPIASASAALESAAAMGYPVVVKPRKRSHGAGVTVVHHADDMPRALDRALEFAPEALVEKWVEGDAYRILVGNHAVVGVFDSDGRDVRSGVGQASLDLAVGASRAAGVGLLEMTVVTQDPKAPLAPGSAAVVDVDYAPRLDRFLKPDSDDMQQAVESLLDWVFPPGARVHVPVVAVTGTNGKTTTSRMVARMFADSGLCTALVCTDGAVVYRGEEVETWEGSLDIRFRQLDEPEIEAAVQESHFGLIARAGFPWVSCDVGVVTNVTPDHIGRLGVESLDAMAELKSTVARRARTAVLNADDPRCAAMAGQRGGEGLFLVTLQDDASAARERAGAKAPVILCGNRGEREWLVLDEAGGQTPIIAVGDIPATFQGSARHNVSNAQHAIAAALGAGLSVERIAATLSRFEMSFENTPGRLNLHDNGRFRAILDYAHNEDGLRQMVRFIDKLDCPGRRILLFAASAMVSDEMIRVAASVPAGHFDHYVCKTYSSEDVDLRARVPDLMRASLEGAGVAPERIVTEADEWKALEIGLEMVRDGDLLVVLTGRTAFGQAWERILRA